MSLRAAALVAFAFVASTGASAQESRRHVDAHVHGEGRLAIAIEAASVEMELEAPASDIVGFEHAATTAAQRKAVADAKAKLAKGSDLIQLTPEAGCTLATATVELTGAVAAAGKPSAHKGHDHGKTKGKAEEAHAEFKAVYRFACSSTGRLTGIALPYFKAFPRAGKLTVTTVGPKGQTSATATPTKPAVPLAGAN